MASINGISVKSLKQFVGYDGETLFQGNLYIQNKKIAFWSQDPRSCAGDIIRCEPAYSATKLIERVKQLNENKFIYERMYAGDEYELEYDFEILMCGLIKLTLHEKEYKKCLKRNCDVMIVLSDGYHEAICALGNKANMLSDDELLEVYTEYFEKLKKRMNFFVDTEEDIVIYRDLSDFCIGDAIAVKEITK